MRRLASAALLIALVPAAALAVEGRAVFERHCAACHAIAAAASPGAGPNLSGIIGRRVGSDPDFDYSPVLQAAREAGRVWDAPSLEEFLADPEAMFPGIWMGANGLRDAGDRLAIIEYLRTRR